MNDRYVFDVVERAVAISLQARREEARSQRSGNDSAGGRRFRPVVPRMLNKQAAGELGIVEKRSQCIEPGSWWKMRAGSLTGLVQLADKAGVIAVTF